jgi:hypothetical protein
MPIPTGRGTRFRKPRGAPPPPHPAADLKVRRSGLDRFFTLCGATCPELKIFVITVIALDLGAALLLRLVIAYCLGR